MIPIVKWELKQRKSSIFWWTLSAVAIVVVILLIYPPLKHQADQFNKVINQLPDGIRQLKAGGSGKVNVADPVDFLNSQLYYITLPILFIILTIGRGSSLIGRDEQDHTLELLLARPVSRGRLLAGKALAGLLETFFITAVSTLAVLVFAKVVGMDIASGRLMITGLYTWLFCLSFGAIAFALTAAGRLTKRASTGIAVLISFGSYLVASLGGLNQTLADVAKFLPYHYFEPEKVLKGQQVGGLNIYLMGIFVATILIAYTGFKSRDIE
jgi:ABC-2 type transport system permease protein